MVVPPQREWRDGKEPQLHPWVAAVYQSFLVLGKDEDGTPTQVEQCKFLDEHHVTDDWERRFWQYLWTVMANAAAKARAEIFENQTGKK